MTWRMHLLRLYRWRHHCFRSRITVTRNWRSCLHLPMLKRRAFPKSGRIWAQGGKWFPEPWKESHALRRLRCRTRYAMTVHLHYAHPWHPVRCMYNMTIATIDTVEMQRVCRHDWRRSCEPKRDAEELIKIALCMQTKKDGLKQRRDYRTSHAMRESVAIEFSSRPKTHSFRARERLVLVGHALHRVLMYEYRTLGCMTLTRNSQLGMMHDAA